MDFKTFFIKNVMMSFFVSIACICASMALIGMVFEPEIRFGYEAFLSPLIFGAVAAIPSLVQYSKKDLTLKQTAFRNVLHFILLEVVILSVTYFMGIITSVSMAVSLCFSIFIIYLVVTIVIWVNDKRIAKEFNDALKKMQTNYNAID